jgi:hypothetical protein
MTEAEKLVLLNQRLLDKMLTALDTPKAVPAALLVAISRVATGEAAQTTIKKHQAQMDRQSAATAPLALPTYEPDEYDTPRKTTSTTTPEAPQEPPRVGMYVPDHEDL